MKSLNSSASSCRFDCSTEPAVPVCAHCGFELEVEADNCPLCGALVAGQAGGRGERAEVPGGPIVSWEDPGVPFPANLVRTWGEILTAPSSFFSRLPFDKPLARPILFYIIVVITAAFLSLLVTSTLGIPEGLEEALGSYDIGMEMSTGAVALLTFFITPFVLLFALLINSLVIHLFVAMLVRERRTMGATTRVLCYAVAPYPIAVIPFAGPLVSSIWITVLVILGLRDAHRTTTGRAAAAVLIPLFLFMLLVLLYLILVFALLLSVVEPS